ncbi:MAG: hypothetical protein V4724_37275 [Pseudomonadota bacterium]
MSTLSPLSPRQFQPASLSTVTPQADGKNLRSGNASLQDKAESDLVSLSKNGIDLQQRLDAVGNSTVDLAQNLLGSFAQKLFGDAGKGATISFDSASLDATSSVAGGVQHSSGANGVTDSAAISLTDSSHFLGKGSITTADGRKFDFEIEVQYDYALEASASKTSSPAGAANPAATPAAAGATGGKAPVSAADPLPVVEFPDIKFPGSLQDLFHLFDKPVKTDVPQQGKPDDKAGTLSLRLLNLVNSSTSDTYAPPTESENRAKAVAEAYGATDSGTSGAAAAPAQADKATPAQAAA